MYKPSCLEDTRRMPRSRSAILKSGSLEAQRELWNLLRAGHSQQFWCNWLQVQPGERGLVNNVCLGCPVAGAQSCSPWQGPFLQELIFLTFLYLPSSQDKNSVNMAYHVLLSLYLTFTNNVFHIFRSASCSCLLASVNSFLYLSIRCSPCACTRAQTHTHVHTQLPIQRCGEIERLLLFLAHIHLNICGLQPVDAFSPTQALTRPLPT